MHLIWHILFLGIAFFQMLFMGIQWAVFRRKEYVFYISYIASVSLYILFRLQSATGLMDLQWHPYLLELFDQPMIVFSYWMYVSFAETFLNVKKNNPAVYRYSRLLRMIFLLFVCIKSISIPLNFSEAFKANSYAVAAVIMLCFAVPLVVSLIRRKDILNNFLLWGSLSFITGGIAGLICSLLMPAYGKSNTVILLGVEIGVLVELLLLNTGFMLKNKILQQQVIRGQQQIMEQLMKDKNAGSHTN